MAELQTSGSQAILEEIKEGPELLTISAEVSSAYERGFVDINFFAALALPSVMLSALPYFYLMCFQIIIKRGGIAQGAILRFALGLPRGHAKTTFIKVILAWMIAYKQARSYMVVCSTQPNAENLIDDLSNIMGSPNMEAVYGSWKNNLSVDNKESKTCVYNGVIVMLQARGAMTAVRGNNKDNVRPEVILCDDMQTKENDKSPTERTSLLSWFGATLLKSIETKGNRLVLYIGNMYSDKCILKQLQDSPYWISLITGAILENGEPLWKEIHSLESLMESFFHDESLGLADEWYAEVMNDPRSVGTSLLPIPLPIPELNPNTFDGVFITIDPAGYRKTSDDNVVVGHGIHDNKGVVLKTAAGKFTPEQTVKTAIAMAIELGATVIGVETVGYQQSLQFWLQHYLTALEITGIQVVELKPHGRSKESRIRAFVQELYEGNYSHHNPEERALFTFQAMAYKLGAKDNRDDILDAQAYGLDMRTEYWHMIGNNLNVVQSHGNVGVVADNAPF